MANGLLVLEGLPVLKAALGRKVEELRASSEAAVIEEVKAIKDDAQATAPRDTGELEGDVESSAEGLRGTISSTSGHSVFVEYGTFKDTAQPFMRPAAERARRRFPVRAAALIRAALGGR